MTLSDMSVTELNNYMEAVATDIRNMYADIAQKNEVITNQWDTHYEITQELRKRRKQC